NVSVGRGTEHPFEWVGAPWIDGSRLTEALTRAGLPGVRFEATQFTPRAGPYQDKLCYGVTVQLLDRNAFDATTLGALLVRELYRLWPDTFQIDKTLGMIGSDDTLRRLKKGDPLEDIVASWQVDLTAFNQRRMRYLLYP
ncbi:MAG TPA: serine hydrolase, partial [Aquabacterium sp.]|nr:serine hydrolase [Aquabacterium sp.]